MSETETTEDMPSSGLAPFSELRERQGMSVGDVSARTRMAAKQIEALDRGDYAALPGFAFTKGAIRSYCKVLTVDPQPYLDAFIERNPQAASPGGEVKVANLATTLPQRGDGGRTDKSYGNYWIGAGIAAMAVAILFFFARPASNTNNVATNETVNRATANDGAGLGGNRSANPSNTSVTGVPLIDPPGTVPSASAPAAPPAVPVPVIPVDNKAAKSGLSFELARDAWIEVRDGQGKVLASKLYKKGEDARVDVSPPFSMVVGSASAVNAQLNGKPIDLKTNIKDDVARVTVSTQ
jgi:cytoskeleton protein RodZ